MAGYGVEKRDFKKLELLKSRHNLGHNLDNFLFGAAYQDIFPADVKSAIADWLAFESIKISTNLLNVPRGGKLIQINKDK